MINHFFTLLYNRTEPAASGIYVGLSEALAVPDVVSGALLNLRGTTPASAEAFAIEAVKVVDASTYRTEITAADKRLTYRMDEIGTNSVNSAEFLALVTGISGAVLTLIDVKYTELRDTIRGSKIPQERAAAILVGVSRLIGEANGI